MDRDYGREYSDDECIAILRRAYGLAARLSVDPSTQTGAVLVDNFGSIIGEAANVFPGGVEATPARLADRDFKLTHIVHAEVGAILAAARLGLRTNKATLFAPWFACCNCAKTIIQSGVSRVIGHRKLMDATPERWQVDIRAADHMLDEAGVVRQYVEGEIGGVTILFNKEPWTP